MTTFAADTRPRTDRRPWPGRVVHAVTITWHEMTTPERWFCAYFTALPVLWLAGLMLPVALFIVFGTLLRFVRSPRSVALSLPWLLVALAQSVAVVYNVVEQEQPVVMLAKHALSSYVLGWYVLWAAICIGASGVLRPRVLVRAIARIGFAYVVLAIPAYAIALISHAPFLFVLSPVGHLLPAHSPATVFSFGIFVYDWEDFLGVLLPRLSLFFPWSTAAGYAGLFLVFVMLEEPNARRRRLGIASGVFMVVASMSRFAWLACVTCVACRVFVGLQRRVQLILCCVVLAAGVAVTIAGSSVESMLDATRERFDAARPGSSQSREVIYAATWKAIDEAPWLGHGWPGESTMRAGVNSLGGPDAETAVVGSHSTVSGLIYKGGAITFALLVVALLSCVVPILLATSHSAIARNALAMLVGVGFMCVGEGIESLVVPCLFAFVWIGIALDRSYPRPRRRVATMAHRASDPPVQPFLHRYA